MPRSNDRALASGYALPFEVLVPRDAGFLVNTKGEIVVSLRSQGTQSAQRLRRAFDVFTRLARTGALSGHTIPPGRSGIELHREPAEGSNFRFAIDKAAIDDRSVIVLAHLLFTQRKLLDIRTVRVLIEGVSDYVPIGHDPDENSTYPARYGPLPFRLDDEEPETEAVTYEVEFRHEPPVATLQALEEGLSIWSDAILRGGYALALVAPEDSHLETYDDELTVIGNVAERSYHKLTADDAAIDAALNIFAAIHERMAPIRVVRIT